MKKRSSVTCPAELKLLLFVCTDRDHSNAAAAKHLSKPRHNLGIQLLLFQRTLGPACVVWRKAMECG
jgi:hypothetical protein